MKLKHSIFYLLITCFANQINAQNTRWSKVNLAPYMLSKHPYYGRADCNEPRLQVFPIEFTPIILVDSLYISNDKKNTKITFRYIHSIDQLDTNDMSYYFLVEDSFYRASPNIRSKKLGDSLYFFKLYSNSSNDSLNQFDSVSLVSALKMHDNNCKFNFYFDPCLFQNRNRFYYIKIFSSKKSKPKPIPNCYKISDLKKIPNDAQPVTLTLPLKNYSIGIGYAYFELFDYLKTWDPNTQLILKPNNGKMDVTNTIWQIKYDTAYKKTFASTSVYNGGTDTMYIYSCVSNSGHIKVNRFPNAIAPASWGNFELIFDNTSLSYIPAKSRLILNTRREKSNTNLLVFLNFKIH